jgi:hypothetical protein
MFLEKLCRPEGKLASNSLNSTAEILDDLGVQEAGSTIPIAAKAATASARRRSRHGSQHRW